MPKTTLYSTLQIKSIACILVCFLSWSYVSAQFDIPDTPKEQTSVYDYVNLLSNSQKSQLEEKLIRYSDTTSTQIVVAIIATTKGENIGLLAPRWAHKWGIGQAKEDNGVFILLANDDREIWISPGYGVEHKLTAGITGELTRNVIIPEFKRGDFYGGLDKGTDAIFQILQGEYQGTPKKNSSNGFPIGAFLPFLILFIIVLIALSKNRRNGGNGGSGGRKNKDFTIWDAIILSNMGRGSYGGSSGWGSSSGGGFGGGFGGGGFSGGGAGGSW
ncbi:TPM domain-containing protein [Mangrovimonas spongiae]|uniref:TPM domain-containing protein n=1 Tax=Mangrovimonas spongiae TaxID=2494697 RepID=A0A428JY56_9FLAO|nr:TPM domain-containing protein [Mangrovimonas spongiae]RSK39071.1 TPM domain-containing protein [Mangrovimonas spongiae]